MKLEEIIDHSHDEVGEMLAAPEPFSVFEDYSDFKILMLRRIEFIKERLSFKSEFFILKEKEVYYFSRDEQVYVKLAKSYQELVRLLEGYYKNNQKIINAYTSQVESLEDELFERNVSSVFMDMWFDLKRDLSKLENYYYRNGIVYHEFLKFSDAQFGKYKDDFKDIEDGIQFHSSNIHTLKSRLDGVHHYYDSIKSDRLNRTLLMLTIISGIFLPLNLIVGFFGMNTPGLFFKEDSAGTEKVLVILASVLLACVLGIQMIRMADKYILRFIIGRYSFYKNISKRIDELSERLRGH
jgi:magnesium transporter